MCLALYANYDKFVTWPYVLQPISIDCAGQLLRDITIVYGSSGPVGHEGLPDMSFLQSLTTSRTRRA
jgi:hypothetical protein